MTTRLINNTVFGICIGITLTACSKSYKVEDFKAHPELAKEVTQSCMQLAKDKKNPFKEKSCQELVLFESEQCKKSNSYFEANQCENVLYLLTRELSSQFPKEAL